MQYLSVAFIVAALAAGVWWLSHSSQPPTLSDSISKEPAEIELEADGDTTLTEEPDTAAARSGAPQTSNSPSASQTSGGATGQPTTGAASSPQTSSPTTPPETVSQVKNSITERSLRLTRLEPIPLLNTNASLILNGVDEESGEARITVRTDGSDVRYDLTIGSTRELTSAGGSYVSAIETVAVDTDQEEVLLRLFQYPRQKTVVSLPYTSILLPGQTVSVTAVPQSVEQFELESVNRIHASINTFVLNENGTLARKYPNQYEAGQKMTSPSFNVHLLRVHSDGGYEGKSQLWGPHVVEVRIEEK